ncbi:MAG: tyrosine--tRNA ligase [Deltaproteobacteria bacterium]|nr:tyrosine--tRNA ligase [Deltaproteobacteria bacterium]
MTTRTDQVAIFRRGAVDLISEEELCKKLRRGTPLRIKAGFDPTAPDLHLGHTVLLQKMRQLQDLGHQIIFLIGDYTAKVGDPSGRSTTRPQLSDADIAQNVATYKAQVFNMLDPQQTEIRFNSEWLGAMTPADLFALAAKYTVARMLEREDFRQRLAQESEISILELLYPLLTGYDSVVLKADVELGGTDQKFNLTVARAIQRRYGVEEEILLTMPLLVGTDGVRKMSKSYGNHVAIQDPPREMFGKLMSISDALMWDYYLLLSACSAEEIAVRKCGHPKEAKVALAKELVTRFHSRDAAEQAAEEFSAIFRDKGKPTDMPTYAVVMQDDGHLLVDLLVGAGLTQSKGEARRLMTQHGVRLDDVVVNNIAHRVLTPGTYIVQVGKRRFCRITLGKGH